MTAHRSTHIPRPWSTAEQIGFVLLLTVVGIVVAVVACVVVWIVL
jgi:biopolymer transport protein ExbB/TolQ